MRQSRRHPHTSTELDVATWWEHVGEPGVQFDHKVLEIFGGLSSEYIQHLSVHESEPARTDGDVQRHIDGPNVEARKGHRRTCPASNAAGTSSTQV